jgi:DNA-binding helix-hairpin-helix protein with protein kinase domain
MKVLTCSQTGQAISLVHQIASSGEGEIWQTQLKGSLAKVYHLPRLERTRKLEVMVAHPPIDPNAHLQHISFAWPRSLLRDDRGVCVGFLMPEITNSVDLLDVYNPQRRQRVLPGFNWLYLHTTAMNVASIVWAIHEAGYVLGDIKPQNLLVNNRALPAVIDTDSFQVRHPDTGELYRCPVGSEGFTPVELLGRDLAQIEQTEEHDRFRLAVVIHLLLFGDHPFKGKWSGYGDSPEPNELVRQGYWPYAPHSPIQPGPLTIPLDTVHSALQHCFLRCFNEGHQHPSQRPSAKEWVKALRVATTELKVCRKNRRHYYSFAHGRCSWCERKAALGIDIFPSAASLANSRWNKRWQRMQKQLKIAIGRRLGRSQGSPGLTYPAVQSITTARVPSFYPTLQTQPTLNPAVGVPYYQRTWVQFTGAIVSVGTVLTLFAVLSESKLDQNTVELTIVGIMLCLGLVALCVLWTRVFKLDNL